MTKFNILRSAVFAGVCIGIAGFGFLADKMLGMFLFIFGLATVVSYKLKLFTGTAGFVRSGADTGLNCLIKTTSPSFVIGIIITPSAFV